MGGYGANGEVTYIDSVMAPFPAIRFKEDKGEIAALRTKEQGDWKKLTVEEKKALYRASFCQTLAEVEAPTGEGKSILGWRACRGLHRHLGILLDEVRRLWSPARHDHQRREAEGPDRPYDLHQGQPCRGNFFELRL